MTAMASVLTPFDATPPIELGNSNTWRKRILPVGSISYQGRQLNFTREYLKGLVSAWQQRAYDAVPFQLADASNTHSNDPERTRGRVVDMELADDGLYITAELTPRGQQVLAENPYLGVSARIVEQYSRADGEYFPAAIQHVLGTLDPRIPGLGAWQPVDMANDGSSAITIDLSSYSFAGDEPWPEPIGISSALTSAELNDLIDVLDEVGAFDEPGYDGTEAAMYDEDYHAAAEQFDAAFTARAQADAAREEARAAAIVQDTMCPARRDEDRMQRLMSRVGQGVYDGMQADFSSEAAGVEIMLANGGRGPCGVPDEFGRCSARFHDLECGHGQAVDWVASGPHPETGAAALANLEAAIELAGPKGYSHGWIKEAMGLGSATETAAAGAGMPLGLKPHQEKIYHALRKRGHSHKRAFAFASRAAAAFGRATGAGEATQIFNQSNTVWGDPDELDEPWQQVPQSTVELAGELVHEWGFDAEGGFGGGLSYGDLPSGPVSVYDALAEGAGQYQVMHAAPSQPGYPGISDLARSLGLK